MPKYDFKKELYKYWDTSIEYYQVAESVHASVEGERKNLFKIIRSGMKILDVACGSCVNKANFTEKVFYCGIDLSLAGLSAAKRSGLDGRLVKADAEKLPIRSKSFDSVISTNAVEHFLDPKSIFNEMWRVCKKEGFILLIFPNYGDYIFRYPSSLSYLMQNFNYKIRYIIRQFYRQTVRIFNRSSFFFATIDRVPSIFVNPYLPDSDVVYLASGREVKNYFESLGASVTVESKNKLSFARPFYQNLLRNIFRLYKSINPYYSWHGDTILIIRKLPNKNSS